MFFNSFAAYLKIMVVLFDADTPTVGVYCGNGGGHAACRIVEDQLAFIGIGLDKILYKGNWLWVGCKPTSVLNFCQDEGTLKLPCFPPVRSNFR